MKRYSDKFVQEYSKLSKSIIGFEFEFYIKDISFYKTLEILNKELDPVKVHGFRQYHSEFKVDSKNFKIEPDLSGGSNMVELITGPLPYNDSKYYLVKILKFIRNYGYTNEKCSIHFNLSFDDVDKNLNDLNVLKLILNTDEEEIFRFFPSRKDSIYAKSVKKIIPYKEYDFFNIPIETVSNLMRIPNDKYYGINFTNINNSKDTQRIEFRYLGGKDYEMLSGNIIYFLDKFALNAYNSTDVKFDISDSEKLEKYLEENISRMKSFLKYESFIIEFPNIKIQIDQNSVYEIVNSYFPEIYKKIWSIIDSCDIGGCIINYVTSLKSIEIVDSTIKVNSTIKEINFIGCDIKSGIFDDCSFYGCEVDGSQISNSNINRSDIIKSKINDSNVEASTLTDCFFMGGLMNGDMVGGIWRSGELGPYSTISSSTKMVNDYTNFFDTKFSPSSDVDKKGIMKFKK